MCHECTHLIHSPSQFSFELSRDNLLFSNFSCFTRQFRFRNLDLGVFPCTHGVGEVDIASALHAEGQNLVGALLV